MVRPKKNQLLQALISELPDGGTDWPVERQIGWLNMMAMAFGVIYGGNAAQQINAGAEPVMQTNYIPEVVPFKKPEKPKPVHQFIIDEEGFVLNAKSGDRLMPDQVKGPVTDLRGQDGDLATIIWADDSVGLNGADITVSAA